MIICRDPSEYKLIGKAGHEHSKLHPSENLWRLCPDRELPDGYEEVRILFSKPVYEEDGRLKPKFMALRRYGRRM